MAKKKWMQGAFANSHGQFKAAAAKAGMSTAEFAKHELASPTASTHRKRQAALAERGMKASKGKKKRKRSAPKRSYGGRSWSAFGE